MGHSLINWLPVLIGLIIGKLLGGKFSNLADVRLKHIWLLLAGSLGQVWLVLSPPVPPASGPEPLRMVLPLAMAAVGGFVWINRHLPGSRFVLLGTVANFAVIVANGGLMPANPENLARAGMFNSIELARTHPGIRLPRSKDVMLEWKDTRLPWLSDALVSPPLPKVKIMSIGDAFMAFGIAYLMVRASRGEIDGATHKEEVVRDAAGNTDSMLGTGSAATGRVVA